MNAASIHSELVNLVLFYLCIAKMVFLCGGYIAVPLLLAEVALNLSGQGRQKGVRRGH